MLEIILPNFQCTSQSFSAAQNGKYYELTTGSQAITDANGYLALQLTNPANSGKTVYINTVRATSSVATIISTYKNATLNITGTSAIPHNTNWAYSDASLVTGRWVAQSSDPTSGGVLLQQMNQIGGVMELNLEGLRVIPSLTTNQTYYILLQNSAANSNLSINVEWWEF